MTKVYLLSRNNGKQGTFALLLERWEAFSLPDKATAPSGFFCKFCKTCLITAKLNRHATTQREIQRQRQEAHTEERMTR